MTKILFVCHGNICRSPMAEFLFRELARQRGVVNQFEAASAATSTEEIGNPVYPPVRRLLAAHGIDCTGKRARQMTREDYDRYDLLLGMDSANIRNMLRICGGDPERKIARILDGTAHPRDIADPWYTDEYQPTWDDLMEGCQALLDRFFS